MLPRATSSSADPVFVDTNVLIYARDVEATEKGARVRAWMHGRVRTGRVRVNLQVLNGLTGWLLKREPRRSIEDVRSEVAALRSWGAKPLTRDEVDLAWVVRERLGYQWFDCLLLAAAHRQGCRAFLTEDMTHGAVFEGVTLVNPFRVSPDDFFQRN